MNNFPPFPRYWPVYAVFLLIIAVLGCLAGLLLWEATAGGQAKVPLQNAWVLLGGVFVAAAAIAANAWSQWRTSSVAHALEAIQTLRTDERYLANVLVVKENVKFGTPLTETKAADFRKLGTLSTIDKPSFRDASIFVLNQYEFVAAAARSGAVDLHLLDQTVGGTVVDLVKTYAEEIKEFRKKNKRTFENLIWLECKFRDIRVRND